MSSSARSEEALSPIFTGRRVELHSLLDTGIDFQYSLNLVGETDVTPKANAFLEIYRYRVSYNKETGECKLEISMTFADDAGEYTILAKNQHGEASASTSLLEEG